MDGTGLFGGFGGLGCNKGRAVSEGGCVMTCEDKVALTSAIYQGRITELQERFSDRQVINQEMFGLYKSQTDADFGLYVNQRNQFDVLQKEISDLKAHVAVTEAIRPYQDQIINLSICDARKDAAYNLEREMCRVIKGEVVLPQVPTVTGFPSYSCGCGRVMTPAPAPSV